MNSHTQSITLECRPEAAFEFLSNPENLPKWATGFCRRIRNEGGHWIAETPEGEVEVRLVTAPEQGVVDFHLSPEPGLELIALSRVVPNGDGAEYLFTQHQPPGMPEEIFRNQVRTLREELQVLKRILEA